MNRRVRPDRGSEMRTAIPPTPHSALLEEIAEDTFEQEYVEAALRRGRLPAEELHLSSLRPTGRKSAQFTGFLIVGILVTIVLALAVAQSRASTRIIAESRTQLIDEINSAIESADERAASNRLLRADLEERQRRILALSEAGELLNTRLREAEFLAGATRVSGPAVRITLTPANRDDADPVLDADLQTVVNSLWAAGAEAIAVNGERLSSLTAIRAAGATILVDYRPVKAPYEVIAIGPQSAMNSALKTGPMADYLRALSNRYGIRSEIATLRQASLKEVSRTRLTSATPLVRTPEPADEEKAAP
jgi:uncharacterized protein YlxW (UPF0749 family)